MSGYSGGRIVRIKMKNFITYTDLEIHPKTGLNLILGINGSGKSTIMSAICLALAGKPLQTGKSNTISDFIQHGHDKALIEVELDNPKGRNSVITRLIQDDKSIWLLNGSSSSLSEVQKVVNKFNIDVGNLCQFLPQEKVVEFSKMDKKQRLENMLQAIGEPKLHDLFEELKSIREKYSKMESSHHQQQKSKQLEEQRNQQLQMEVDRQNERTKLKGKLELLQFKHLALRYNIKREEWELVKLQKKKMEKEKSKKQAELDKQIAEKMEVEKEFNQYLGRVTSMGTQLKKITEKLTKNSTSLAECHHEVEKAKVEFQKRIEEKRNQKARLERLEAQIRGLTELFDKGMQEKDKLAADFQRITKDRDQVKTLLNDVEKEIQTLNQYKNRNDNTIQDFKRNISRLQDEEDKKLQILRNRFPHIYEAVKWFEANRHLFKKNICPPPILSIRVKGDENRKYIENCIPQRDLLAFVCEDKEDCKLLTNILKSQKKLSVNIVLAPLNAMPQSHNITTPMRTNLPCSEDDMYRYLISNGFQAGRDQMLPERSLHCPRSGDEISLKKSRYGQRLESIKRDHIGDRNLLPSSKDNSEKLHQLQSQLTAAEDENAEIIAQLQAYMEQRQEHERKHEVIRQQASDLSKRAQEIKNFQLQLNEKKQSYNRYKNDVIDEDAEKRKITQIVQNLNKEKFGVLKDIQSLLKDFIQTKTDRLKAITRAKSLQTVLESCSSEIKEKIIIFDAFKKEYEKIEADRRRSKAEGKRMYEEIETLSKQFPNNVRLGEQTIEEVESQLAHVQAQLDLNCEDNESVLREYNERVEEIRALGRRIESCAQELESLKRAMQTKREEWLPRLHFHIGNINRNFSEYYRRLNCAGEISLDQGEDLDDFPNYGLRIRLQYRESEPLNELSQTHHSGGECSVAAILFILSLQELARVPFRCIDEINQGMDSRNERKIYDLIADSARDGSCSQYFLLTPKLLVNLGYHEDVCVHVIYNSSFLNMQMSLDKHLKIQ